MLSFISILDLVGTRWKSSKSYCRSTKKYKNNHFDLKSIFNLCDSGRNAMCASKPLVLHIFRRHFDHLSIIDSDSVVITTVSVRSWSKKTTFSSKLGPGMYILGLEVIFSIWSYRLITVISLITVGQNNNHLFLLQSDSIELYTVRMRTVLMSSRTVFMSWIKR